MSTGRECKDVQGKARSFFLNELRQARQAAQKDNDAFDKLLFVFERLGSFRLGLTKDLGQYRRCLLELANTSALAKIHAARQGPWHSEAEALYALVKEARNDALHQGASVRHLTEHAIELGLLFEDALMSGDSNEANGNTLVTVGDIMVRSPTQTYDWHPVSFARQIMLTNSFSFLPIQTHGKWKLLSDIAVATYLRKGATCRKERVKRLGKTIGDAVKDGDLNLGKVHAASVNDSIASVLENLAKGPILVFFDRATAGADEGTLALVGLLTAFDVL